MNNNENCIDGIVKNKVIYLLNNEIIYLFYGIGHFLFFIILINDIINNIKKSQLVLIS